MDNLLVLTMKKIPCQGLAKGMKTINSNQFEIKDALKKNECYFLNHLCLHFLSGKKKRKGSAISAAASELYIPPFRLFAWLSSARDDISAPKAALYLAAHTPAGSHYSVNALAQPRLPPLHQNTSHR